MTPASLDELLKEWETEAKAYSKFHIAFTCSIEELKMKDDFSKFAGAYVQKLIAVVRKQGEALKNWNQWAELMVDEGVLDHDLIAEYHAAEEALTDAERILNGKI